VDERPAGRREDSDPVRVLVAEDDAASRRRLERTLQRWGFEVFTARDGREALEQYKAVRPQIALVDWLMPELDGVEVCREIRSMPEGDLTQLILVSSRAERTDVVRGLESGADAHLAKPWTNDDLRAYLAVAERVLQRQRTLRVLVSELEAALRQRGGDDPVSMCSYCRQVLSAPDRWMPLEQFLCEHTSIRFSHGICPTCFVGVRREWDQFAGEHED